MKLSRKWSRRATAAALSLIMTCSMAAVSQADGWVENVDGWYYDEAGQNVTSVWKKGELGYYYLDDSGRLASCAWVDSGETKYYVDADGLRLKNQWVYTKSWDNPDDNSEYWYYFNSNGSMVTGKQQIGDKKYFFTEEGKMLTGWVTFIDGAAENLTTEVSDGNTYYCLENGERASGWLQLEPPSEEENNGEIYWYNFEGNGKIRKNAKPKLGDNQFCFDAQGRMIDGWAYKTADTNTFVSVDENTDPDLLAEYNKDPSRYVYCGQEDVGVVQKNIWLQIMPPGKEGDPDTGKKWYWFDQKGSMTVAKVASSSNAVPTKSTPANAEKTVEVRKVKTAGSYGVNGAAGDLLRLTPKQIDGKYYLFNTDGQMVEGLMYIYNSGSDVKIKEGYYCYETAGSRTTGKVLKEAEGTQYEYFFAKKSENGHFAGQGVTGIFNGKLYYRGLCVTAEEDYDFSVVSIPELKGTNGTGLYLVDKNGRVKSGTTPKEEDGSRYKVNDNKKNGAVIYKIEESGPKEGVVITPEDADITLDFETPELIN